MSAGLPNTKQLVLDFDGVLCDSTTECLHIAWGAWAGVPVEAFAAREGKHAVPPDVVRRYHGTRRYIRHLAQFVVPLLDGPAPTDRAEFAQRFASLPDGMADDFAHAAGEYRAAVRTRRRDTWLALHGVWPQVCALVEGAYIATARDRASVLDILGAHQVRPDPARIFDELVDKPAALAEIAERESTPRRRNGCSTTASITASPSARRGSGRAGRRGAAAMRATTGARTSTASQ